MDLDPTGEIKSIPKGYSDTLKRKQTKHGDCDAIWTGQKGKKNFLCYGRKTYSDLFSFSIWGMMKSMRQKTGGWDGINDKQGKKPSSIPSELLPEYEGN